MKKQVLIELNLKEFEAAKFVKSTLGLEWKDLLIIGVLFCVDQVGGVEEFKKIAEQKIELLQQVKTK